MKNISEVVESKACSGCGMCVAACPKDAIQIGEQSLPYISDGCNECGICGEICPRIEMPYTAIEKALAEKNSAKNHDSLLGFYTRICLARASDEPVRSISYSGGSTTSFIRYILENGLIDGALLTDKVHNLPYCAHPRPRVAKTSDDVLACSFTKPTVNPILAKLPVEGERIAFVGNSCHIEAIRKAQFLSEHGKTSKKRCMELVGNIRFLAGLNCFFCNNYNGVELQLKRLGLKEDNIKRFFYQMGIPSVELTDGTVKEIPEGNSSYESLNMGCLLCYPSYTARLSDVTFGKTMSEEWGWNDVIIRSSEVEKIFSEMEKNGLIEAKGSDDGGEELLQSLLEAEVFKIDALGYSQYLETGFFKPDPVSSGMMSRPGGTIKGKTRLRLIQAVRKYSFYEPVVSARKEKGVFVPKLA